MKKDVPFSIGFAIIFAAGFFAFEMVYAGTQSPQLPVYVNLSAPQGTAIVALSSNSLGASNVSSTAIASSTPTITPGLLPNVTLLRVKPASAAPAQAKSVASAVAPKAAPTAGTAAPVPATITALTVLNATTLSFNEQPDGPYKMALAANLGTGAMLTWSPDATTIGGSGAVPAFAAAFSCDPPPTNLRFAVRTSYTCTLTLTPVSGSDRRSQSRTFSFTTGPGQLVVTLPLSMGGVLRNTETDGGLVFTDQDADPVTVTGLSLTVSYTALNTAYGPLVLRFLDPITNASIGDFPLQSLPADASLPYTYTGTVTVPLSFAIKAMDQRMLPLEVLGAQTMDISNVNPSFTITLNAVATDPQNSKTVLSAAKIVWSCIVPIGSYDPNATSGPFATGQACK